MRTIELSPGWNTQSLVGAAFAALFAIACGQGESRPEATAAPSAAPAAAPTPQADVAAAAQAEQIFSTRCFTCHGPNGAGDGPGSAALDPKPRNFTDPAWQASVDDEHIAKIIQFGGVAVGKSPAMPGNPDLMSKPQVVQALVAHVRSLAGHE